MSIVSSPGTEKMKSRPLRGETVDEQVGGASRAVGVMTDSVGQ